MRMELVIRFDYGSIVPWVQRQADGVEAIAGSECTAVARAGPRHAWGTHIWGPPMIFDSISRCC